MNPRFPSVTGSEVVRALRKAGFVIVRISGSHHRLIYPDDAKRAVTVPVHGSMTLKRGTVQSILRQAGISAEELIDLL
jgi:predicted RNA binding protein YcfA (HicA-like mRNA interferase family)